ncbi:MAG: hypothetical protein ACOYJG_06870 [Prevotella sp.]|jgi:hypothetical protein
MKLHIFNPEHDIALAANDSHFTAPHAGRRLRSDLEFLPALWAEDGDCVLVEDIERAQRNLRLYPRYARQIVFANSSVLQNVEFSDIDVWGWNITLREELKQLGVEQESLPSDQQLSAIRLMSNRGWAAKHLLSSLQSDETVGEAFIVHSLDEVKDLFYQYGKIVVKAPWSSSGRGVRYVLPNSWNEKLEGWMKNILLRQHSLEVEPIYNKVKDFAMEFSSEEDGVKFMGYSLFRTINGAYSGNILATMNAKREMLSRYLPLTLLDNVCEKICALLSHFLAGIYIGPLGIDMMIVAENGKLMLHPCVELNLRRTMGHLALALSPTETEPQRLMRILFQDGRYHFRVTDTNENVLDRDIY